MMKYPQIETGRPIHTQPYRWCKEALLIQITNGKSVLTRVCTKTNQDDYYQSQLLLNGKPIMQGSYPVCPTCCGLLARGYGIEKTDTPELEIIRDNINAEYKDIFTAVNRLRPLLGLLDSGYYVIADTELYPTAGDEHFFANVPDELTALSASCEDFWVADLSDVTTGVPSYIYPTQSNECLNIQHARTYLEKVGQENAPRAVAYYDKGFLCALLDGHHKAYACALLGIPLKSTVIIPVTALCHTPQKNRDTVYFADIALPVSDFPFLQPNTATDSENSIAFKTLYPVSGCIVSKITVGNYHNIPVSEKEMKLFCYPPIEAFSAFYAVDFGGMDITDENVARWLTGTVPYMYHSLHYALEFYEKTDLQKALIIARGLLTYYPTKYVFSFLLKNKMPETEQMMIDYLIDHDPSDEFWKMASSYWNES